MESMEQIWHDYHTSLLSFIRHRVGATEMFKIPIEIIDSKTKSRDISRSVFQFYHRQEEAAADRFHEMSEVQIMSPHIVRNLAELSDLGLSKASKFARGPMVEAPMMRDRKSMSIGVSPLPRPLTAPAKVISPRSLADRC